MSRAFSSKIPSLPPTPITTPATSCAKTSQRKKHSPRSPLQDLNCICSSSNSSNSSSISIEAPRGCLGFFLSYSSSKNPVNRPKNLSKTPNSAPNGFPSKQSKSNTSKENLSKVKTGEHTKRFTSEKTQKLRKNPSCLYHWQSGKKLSSRNGQKSKPCSVLNDHDGFLPRLPAASEELKQQEDSLELKVDNPGEPGWLKLCNEDANLTPLSKKTTGSDLDCTVDRDVDVNSNTSTKGTPPIQNSLSPEIQCGSSLVSTTTPACYAAGYVVSGVTDKRKCKPRGILIVEENNSGFDKMTTDCLVDDDDEGNIMGLENNTKASLLPLPTEASMCWLLSPVNKGEKDLSENSENGKREFGGLAESTVLGSISPPFFRNRISLDISDGSDVSAAANGVRRRMNTSISPCGLPEFEGLFDSMISSSCLPVLFSPHSTPNCKSGTFGKGRSYKYNINDDNNSPFSLNSLSSGNVIQTPLSDSSLDVTIDLSWIHAENLKEENSYPDRNSVSDVLPSASLSLSSSMPLADSVNSSFQFDCLTVPLDSIDVSRLPKFLDDRDPSLSSSTIENASQSKMRISWRDGLMSRLYELDEFDCCRYLSDEEDLADDYSCSKSPIPLGPQLNAEDDNKKLNNVVGATDIDVNEMGIDGLGKENFPTLVSCSGAESISTDGDGLVSSRDDSDWSLCYKNRLFEA
ncbi:hypothetical protein L6164_025805 [Bauhinia variegata]|uniref:Uncharacterized protein n=1 Tax=Bauhinia variegata TaxID=167791 RepID=A0ACB9M3H9_BAUVA|nr:hypothetical protein L6164_025805 [Bauhinia variegata]